KDDTCRDVEHKKRGRPKLVDKAVALGSAWHGSSKDSTGTASAKAAATADKTRVKGKYTKSANYKLPKKGALSAKTSSDTYPVPQTNVSPRDAAMGRPLSIHSELPVPRDLKESLYYTSSTSQTKPSQEVYSTPSSAPLATVFLTMDLVCARVSDESQVLWGYHPHDISHKSLHSIVANEDQHKMQHLLELVKNAVFSAQPADSAYPLSHYSFLESSSPVFYQNRPSIMSSGAPGSSEYTDVVRVCYADGNSDLFSVRMYVGGGLGTDLLRGLNLEHSYVVCIMARNAPSPVSDHRRVNDRDLLEEPRSFAHSNGNGSNSGINNTHAPLSAEASYSQKSVLSQPRFSHLEPARKISLPPIFTGTSSTSSPSLSSPSASSSLSSNSSTSRPLAAFGTHASLPSSTSSYTVPLSKPGSQSTSLPSLRTGPLHTPQWLYEAEPFGGSGHSSNSMSGHRVPTVFSDPFRALSAPMGGFGVSKYLNRSEPSSSFGNIRRHQLPLPLSAQSSQGSRFEAPSRTPRSLHKDLSSSAFGASFASQSSPSSMKRPLADMADSQDRNRDIDNRHQDHQQHQDVREAPTSTSMSASSAAPTSHPAYQSSVKLELQSMPPDHPAIDPSSAGVCPIVHGSQQRERVQQAQLQASQVARELEMKEGHGHPIESERGPCRWAKMSDQWSDCRDNGPHGHDCFSSKATTEHREREHDHGHGHELSQIYGHGHGQGQGNGHELNQIYGQGREREREASSKGYFEGSSSSRQQSLSPGSRRYPGDSLVGHFSPRGEDRSSVGRQNGVNPFGTGPSSPTESFSHSRSSNGSRRPSNVSRSSFIIRSSGPVFCLSGACGSVCRCSGEDEEARVAKAMEAARKRMSVHSLLC
ncbi:hypothetical protein BGZ98_001567, partial [Dissophora globulifera]